MLIRVTAEGDTDYHFNLGSHLTPFAFQIRPTGDHNDRRKHKKQCSSTAAVVVGADDNTFPTRNWEAA